MLYVYTEMQKDEGWDILFGNDLEEIRKKAKLHIEHYNDYDRKHLTAAYITGYSDCETKQEYNDLMLETAEGPAQAFYEEII